jgi:NADH:ubiquinone reductase (H+-translocating)
MIDSPHIVIIGGGFAGLWAALAARREIEETGGAADISLLSKDPYLVMRPRLYEADPESLRVPLAPVIDPVDVAFVGATVTAIDPARRTVSLAAGDALAYDRLVVAAGSVLKPLPVDGAAQHAFDIDSWDGAVRFDRHLATLFSDPARAVDQVDQTVVIVGGGFTGIELAAEMRNRIERHGGRDQAAAARVIVVEQAGAVGPDLGPGPRPVIEEALKKAGVEVRLGATVHRVDARGVDLADGERIDARTVIVTAGPVANPLAQSLAGDRDSAGRLLVDDMLRVGGVDGIFAAGDIAHARVDAEGHVALMSCQHAMTMGRFAGHNAARDLIGLALTPYRQERYVTCLDLGPAGAVRTEGWDRRVIESGDAAKAVKRDINSVRIYPPTGDRATILAAAAPIAVRPAAD